MLCDRNANPLSLMKSLFSLRVPLWTLALWVMTSLLNLTQAQTIIIDPGHGGRDPGAVRPGVMEKQVALATSRYLASELARRGFRVVLTRQTDVFLTLAQRRDLSQRYPGCVFVSLHYNAAVNAEARGVETYYHGAASRALAAHVQGCLARLRGVMNRGVKRRGYAVLAKNTASRAILVEAGFLSNVWERQRCLDPNYQRAVAMAVSDGLEQHLRGSMRASTPLWAQRTAPSPAVLATFRGRIR